MSTMTHPTPRAKTRRRAYRIRSSSLGLWIGRTHYRVAPIRPRDDTILAAWSLTKGDGECSTISATAWGCECECPDFIFRRGEAGGHCKHAAAAVARGLLPAPGPW